MTVKRYNRFKGISLIEVMAAILVLSVVVIGTSGFRYHAALGNQKVIGQLTAARVGLLLSESWRGVKGDETFSPIDYLGSELAIANASAVTTDVPIDFTELGYYEIDIDGSQYLVTLSWNDISSGLRVLNVVVTWNHRNCPTGTTDIEQPTKSIKFTTYAQI